MASFTAVDVLHWVKGRLRFLRGILPERLRKRIYSRIADRTIATLPSRTYMTTTFVPALAVAGVRKLLVVGTRSYNQPFYRACKNAGMAVWSIDLDPTSGAVGAPDGHFIGNVMDLERIASGLVFDAVCFNGVIGFGIDTPEDAETTISTFQAMTAPDAILLVGWNPGRGDAAMPVVRRRLPSLALGNMPAVTEFPPFGAAQPRPHRYELFRLKK